MDIETVRGILIDLDLRLYHAAAVDQQLKGDEVWPPEVEDAFLSAVHIFASVGQKKYQIDEKGIDGGNTELVGRNDIISRYIFMKTNKYRARKQVSSHIQVWAHCKKPPSNREMDIAEFQELQRIFRLYYSRPTTEFGQPKKKVRRVVSTGSVPMGIDFSSNRLFRSSNVCGSIGSDIGTSQSSRKHVIGDLEDGSSKRRKRVISETTLGCPLGSFGEFSPQFNGFPIAQADNMIGTMWTGPASGPLLSPSSSSASLSSSIMTPSMVSKKSCTIGLAPLSPLPTSSPQSTAAAAAAAAAAMLAAATATGPGTVIHNSNFESLSTSNSFVASGCLPTTNMATPSYSSTRYKDTFDISQNSDSMATSTAAAAAALTAAAMAAAASADGDNTQKSESLNFPLFLAHSEPSSHSYYTHASQVCANTFGIATSLSPAPNITSAFATACFPGKPECNSTSVPAERFSRNIDSSCRDNINVAMSDPLAGNDMDAKWAKLGGGVIPNTILPADLNLHMLYDTQYQRCQLGPSIIKNKSSITTCDYEDTSIASVIEHNTNSKDIQTHGARITNNDASTHGTGRVPMATSIGTMLKVQDGCVIQSGGSSKNNIANTSAINDGGCLGSVPPAVLKISPQPQWQGSHAVDESLPKFNKELNSSPSYAASMVSGIKDSECTLTANEGSPPVSSTSSTLSTKICQQDGGVVKESSTSTSDETVSDWLNGLSDVFKVQEQMNTSPCTTQSFFCQKEEGFAEDWYSVISQYLQGPD